MDDQHMIELTARRVAEVEVAERATRDESREADAAIRASLDALSEKLSEKLDALSALSTTPAAAAEEEKKIDALEDTATIPSHDEIAAKIDALEKRVVAAEDAADEDSAFAAVDGVGIVHYKLRAPNNDAKDENDASSRDVATVVSCVHGFGANAYSFERATAAPLADALNAVVVAHDSPGFGLTERPRDLRAYTPRANAKVCRAMLRLAEAKAEDATGSRTPLRTPPRRVAVGHSMGALAVALAAGEGGIDDVVLVAPAIVPKRRRKNTERQPARKRLWTRPLGVLIALASAVARVVVAALARALSPFLVLFLRKIVRNAAFWREGLASAVGSPMRRVMRDDRSWTDGYRRPSVVTGWDRGMARVVLSAATGGLDGVAATARDGARRVARAVSGEESGEEDAAEALARSGARVLIVHGDEDVIVPRSNSEKLAAALPRAELVVVRGCGHMPHEECPDVFLDAVRAFLRKGERGGDGDDAGAGAGVEKT
uniref:AB hydrolase-1 domain-containing protein n=1 Tax=Micromonas pusilla TaxID=38833 RepID=A0A7R9TQM1_MICPS